MLQTNCFSQKNIPNFVIEITKTMSILGFIRTLLFSLLLTFFLVDTTRELECAFSDFAKQSAKLKINEYNFQQSSNSVLIGGIRFQNRVVHETRFSPKNNFVGFGDFVGNFSFLLLLKQKTFFCFEYYSAKLFWAFNVPKYLLLRQILR